MWKSLCFAMSCLFAQVTVARAEVPTPEVDGIPAGQADPVQVEPQPPSAPRAYPPPPPPRLPDGPGADYPFPVATAASPDATAASSEAGGVYRRLSLTTAVGPGALFGPGERDLAVSYQLARLGVGLDKNIALLFGFEGVGTNTINPKTNSDSWLKQDTWSLGLQRHFPPRLYVRGGLGVSSVSEKSGNLAFKGGQGIAVSGALGYEIIQRTHVALAIDIHGSTSHYPRESWQTLGFDLAVSFF